MYKVFIATAFTDYERALNARAIVEEAGFEVTSQWEEEAKKAGHRAGSVTVNLTPQKAREESLRDIDGIYAADFLLLLTPDVGRGCYFEAGVAYETGTPVVIVNDGGRKCVYEGLGQSGTNGVLVVPTVYAAVKAMREHGVRWL